MASTQSAALHFNTVFLSFAISAAEQDGTVAVAGKKARLLVKPFSSCPLWKYMELKCSDESALFAGRMNHSSWPPAGSRTGMEGRRG